MKLGYVELKEKAKKKGWAIPSYTTVKEYLNNEIPEAVKERHRRGRKSFEDKVLRPILRDPSDLKPMEVIESDHHQVDVAVKMPDGRVVFPWLTAWMCVRTRKILGWVLVSSPNSDSINISLYQTISKYGVPEKVHLDNGKDYRAKMFTGEGRKGWIWGKTKVEIDEKAFQGIYGDLGIDIMWATPYNAKTKIIERFFKTFRTEFSVYWRTYRGKDKTERPEELDKRIRKRDVVDFEYLKNAIHYWVDVRYNNEREHRGKGMELRTPNNVFFSMLKTKRAVREEELSLLCTREPKMKTVQNYGIDLFGGWYWNDKIQELYFGRKVGVRHREDDISQIYVFDPEGVFLGIAKRVDDGTWGMNEKDYKRLMQLKKVMRESVKNWEIEHMPVRMTEEEREALISKNEKEYIEPELKGKYINTKYTQIVADIVAEEELENMEEGKKKNANKNFNQIQATFFDDFDNLQKEEADDFILEFGRYE
jgi:transposase InsO family protein